jgi:hypothetical protein
MIPTLLVIGLVLGRWWRLVLPVATIGWPMLLVLDGVGTGVAFWVSAGAFALANTIAGVAVNRLAVAAAHRAFQPAATKAASAG